MEALCRRKLDDDTPADQAKHISLVNTGPVATETVIEGQLWQTRWRRGGNLLSRGTRSKD